MFSLKSTVCFCPSSADTELFCWASKWSASDLTEYMHQGKQFLVVAAGGGNLPAELVPGELIKSRGDWSLVQPSTVPPPLVRIERYWCHRSVNSRLWQASFQPRMRSIAIIVMLKIEQLRLEIGGRP